MNPIASIIAREIKDSRGKPTLEVILSSSEHIARAAVPSGKSAGSHEAVKLPVAEALKIIEMIVAPALVGQPSVQEKIDQILLEIDGTENKSKLGGNVMIGVSMAAARLAAAEKGIPLWRLISEENNTTPSFPALFMNLINGGVHADFRLPFQEYIVVLTGPSPRRAYESGVAIFAKLGELIKIKYGTVPPGRDKVPMGDEGGYSPQMTRMEEPFELLNQVCVGAENTFLAIDAAASEFYQDGVYNLSGLNYTSKKLSELYQNLVRQFPLKSIEDPFFEDEPESFKKLTEALGQNILIVGDDLTVTNPKRIGNFIKNQTVNAVIIKPNQIGTLTETYEAVRLAHKAGWKCIVSHRSGDTPDSFIADLAVGLGAYGLKAGSPLRPERKAKYDRLIEINEREMVE